MPVAVILGSAYGQEAPPIELEAFETDTPWGPVTLHRSGDALILFRHGLPHCWLPNQIPYRAHAWALREQGCEALLVTSSVGVLDPRVPLYEPLIVSDLLMPENRLPDGSACSMWPEPAAGQGHLVVREGLFSPALATQVERLLGRPAMRVTFAYVQGPRTKTPAENRLWAQWGAQVNSMTVGPEVVLANELEIPTTAVVVGHKYSVATGRNPDKQTIAESFVHARAAMDRLIVGWLEEGRGVPFGNEVYRFAAQ